jgi:hypothetical protein
VQAALVRAPSFQQMLLATPNSSPVEFRRSLVADLALWEPVVKARIEDRLKAQEACKPDHSPPCWGALDRLGLNRRARPKQIMGEREAGERRSSRRRRGWRELRQPDELRSGVGPECDLLNLPAVKPELTSRRRQRTCRHR